MDSNHLMHGLAGDEVTPDWPVLALSEVTSLLHGYPQLSPDTRIEWHSSRPLSAACLVHTSAGTVFVKRHHLSVRTVATLTEEHSFIAHLRERGMPIPTVLRDAQGQTAVSHGDWVYEVHELASGIDLYREAISWAPLVNTEHALQAGCTLATLHHAAAGYAAAQRSTHILVARSELISAADPIAMLQAQLPQRPGLADYLRQRDWQAEFTAALTPWHPRLQPALAAQPRLWTHGDWHASNLCWSDAGGTAQITAVLDFGLAAANCALFDLATAIERNAIAWLALDAPGAGHQQIAQALITGYRQVRPLSADEIHLLADLLPLVHVDFALSEVEYFHAITRSTESADVAWKTFLLGHAHWFGTATGQALRDAVRECA
jgi:Ser/Thr protein kinase RdoA (MazF antagonist)